jgi:hypothetical protein
VRLSKDQGKCEKSVEYIMQWCMVYKIMDNIGQSVFEKNVVRGTTILNMLVANWLDNLCATCYTNH